MRINALRTGLVAAGAISAMLALTPAAHAAGSGSGGVVTPAQKYTLSHTAHPGVAARAVVCSDSWFDGDATQKTFGRSDANVRSGPSTGCSINGAIYRGYTVYYDCFRDGQDPGTGVFTWTHLGYWVNNVRYNGWVNDGLLPVNADGNSQGSLRYCES